jgi:hypothetical protein
MRHAQKTELFTPVVAGLGHEKTGGAVMLRTAHSAQRTTHNAQRRTQNARRLSAWGLPQWCRGRRSSGGGGMPRCALCSGLLNMAEVSAWWSWWCNPCALEGCSAAPPGAWGCRSLWDHAHRWAGCQAAVPRLGAWNPSPAMRYARQPGWRFRSRESLQIVEPGISGVCVAPAGRALSKVGVGAKVHWV